MFPDMSILLLPLIVLLFALLFEICDSSLGQGYGTLGSPAFVLMGFAAKLVVPSILISQAVGGLVGAYFHNRYGNVDFSNRKTKDIRKVYFIVACGIIGVIIASFVGVKISKDIMVTYIGIVVLAMGILMLSGIILKFTWKKLAVIGSISAFNKGLSGGGYGPVVAGGQTIIGIGSKASVGITDFAEAPICISGFSVWCLLSGLPPLDLMVPMCIGAGVAPILGAWITKKLPVTRLKQIMGVTIVILGVLCLLKVLNP